MINGLSPGEPILSIQDLVNRGAAILIFLYHAKEEILKAIILFSLLEKVHILIVKVISLSVNRGSIVCFVFSVTIKWCLLAVDHKTDNSVSENVRFHRIDRQLQCYLGRLESASSTLSHDNGIKLALLKKSVVTESHLQVIFD